MPLITQVAEAVIAELNGAMLSQPFTAVRPVAVHCGYGIGVF